MWLCVSKPILPYLEGWNLHKFQSILMFTRVQQTLTHSVRKLRVARWVGGASSTSWPLSSRLSEVGFEPSKWTFTHENGEELSV